MEAASDLTAAVAAARAVAVRFHTASDDELLADARAVEDLGRVADALRLGVAAQLEHRSRKTLGEESLAFRTGARDGVELVRHITGISGPAATARVGLGAALAPAVALTGELLPGRYPELSAAVDAGEVGMEAARVIVQAARSVRFRAAADDVDAMVSSLTGTAKAVDVEVVRETAAMWLLAVDPDGAEPKERTQRRKRAARFGRTLEDGTTTLSVVLTPEDLAFLKELFQAQRRNRLLVRTTPGGDETAEQIDPEWREADDPDRPVGPGEGDGPDEEGRSRPQQDYDTLTGFLRLGADAASRGEGSIVEPQETIVTITAEDLEARRGQAWAPGIMAGLPVPVIERRACTGGVKLLVTGPAGEPLFLSRTNRVFSPAQRKALIATSGGRCEWGPCRVPHPFLEAHHVDWWNRDHGPTDVDNGVMLCSYHHHLIHATDSPVEIRREGDALYIVPKSWRGPLEDHRRIRRGTSPVSEPTSDPLR